MNPTMIDLLINLVGELNGEVEEQNEEGMSVVFCLETDGYVHSIKWGELRLWDSENDVIEPFEDVEKEVRMEAQNMINFFKGITMCKVKDQISYDPDSESSSSESDSLSSISSDSCDSSSSSNEKSSSSSSISESSLMDTQGKGKS